MKKNILICALIITNVFTGICIIRISWLKMLWKNEAVIGSEFAAKLWAGDRAGIERLTQYMTRCPFSGAG
ncbi:MAG: hypothetical protein GX594_16310 [Pirellulaceae bacterium]|nr:hypothetical protein [Pirellulaceae bacterium]